METSARMAKKKASAASGRRNTKTPARPTPVASAPAASGNQAPALAPEDDVEPLAPEAAFPVVAIGASAGGLEAMTELLGALPAQPGMAFVFVQHSAPSRESLLADLLARASSLPIALIESGMKIEENHGYVAPPGALLDLKDGSFQILAQGVHERDGAIDHFFERLAQKYRTRAIGVVLSGTLSDGALGLRAIRAAGGVTFAQDEETAKYPSMPRAASPYADLMLAPADIARRLPEFRNHPLMLERRPELVAKQTDHQQILSMIRQGLGVNFSLYRQSTIKRRILRRMAVNKIDETEGYVELLRENPGELQALYDDILITVTSFFRDPDTFEVLKGRVFPTLLADRPPGAPMRLWVPGCSSGEEVYSLAIALTEAIGDAGATCGMQIFGTDISERAIERARSGVYLESALIAVSPERKRRFFTRVAGGYQIVKMLRDSCVFARQNVSADPPFSNVDLLSCRNLLIYLDPTLQSKVLRLFHYAIKSKGYLLLGGSETIGSFSELFQPLDRQHRIFTRTSALPWPVTEFGAAPAHHPSREPARPVRPEFSPTVELQRRVDRLVLGAYAPPGVLLNEAFDVLQFRGKTSAFLEPAPGAASLNVLKMAREGLLIELRAALLKARKTGVRVRVEGLRVRRDGDILPANLEVIPVKDEASKSRFYAVLFESTAERVRKSGAPKTQKIELPRPDEEDTVARLEQEIASTKDYLQSIIEELQSSNEELKSANEEILSSNEELQSTNEELETTKEELQSTNEELSIVNEELHTRNEELARAYNDLTNLLGGLDLAVVVLDGNGIIRMLTAVAERLLGISTTDVGRVLSEMKIPMSIPDLRGLINETIESMRMTQAEVRLPDGHWYLVRLRPYRTSDHRIEGVVVAFFDVDPIKQSLAEANRARDYAERLVESVGWGLAVVDESGRIQSANQTFHRLFRTTPQSVEQALLSDLAGWREHAELLKRSLAGAGSPQGARDVPLAMQRDGEVFEYRMSVVRLKEGSDGRRLLLVSVEDVTGKVRLQREVRDMQKLESIGTLAGGVAHDFNNILNIVSAHGSLLRRHQEEPERREASLEAIDAAVRRGSTLVRQLITFARRSETASSTIVRLNEIVREMSEMLRETFPRSVELKVELDPGLPLVAGDPSQIHQALLNLCINARDSMALSGGHVLVKTATVEGRQLRARHPEGGADRYASLHVIDDGSGMDEETRSHIFEPFFTTKGKGLGSGLGLAVVYGIVNAHHGFIEVDSSPGKGTAFRVYLPVSATLEEFAGREERPPVNVRGTETILVVEDEESLRGAVKALLEDEGYSVVTAADGPSGVALFEAHADRIRAVVLDLGLPGFDGVEAFRRLKELRGDVRCIAVSGNLDREDRSAMQEAGIIASIRKPFPVQELLRVLRTALDQ